MHCNLVQFKCKVNSIIGALYKIELLSGKKMENIDISKTHSMNVFQKKF